MPENPHLQKALNGEHLTAAESESLFSAIIDPGFEDDVVAEFLVTLAERGETAEEVCGAARALRRHMVQLDLGELAAIDTCGTGGDGSNTFNISTAAALVTAAAGLPVVKHGNRGISSKSGSADVLRELGVNVDCTAEQAADCVREVGIGFCFAPLYHPGMKRVAAVRKQLARPTIFNMLGPLANPAGAKCQLVGVGKPHQRTLLAGALAQLGTTRSAVVHGEDCLDEVTLGGTTAVTLVTDGELAETTWSPVDFGLATADKATLQAAGPEDSAAIIRKILAGETGPPRDIVIANTGAALWLGGKADSLLGGAKLAADTLDSGAASEKLQRLAAASHQ
jgi:anthranilate phosphoribosyltransferase